MNNDPWGKVILVNGEKTNVGIGEKMFYFRREGTDWLFAVTNQTDNASTIDVENVSLTRVTGEKGWGSLVLVPALPDLPVVIRPVGMVVLPPMHKIQFFVSIPLWCCICLPEKSSAKIYETPIVSLSKTWFGSFSAGNLCYALKVPALRGWENLPETLLRAVCPIKIFNRSRENLSLERICISTSNLLMYRNSSRIWTTEMGIVYRGKDTPERVAYGDGKPEFDSGLSKVRTVDENLQNSFFSKSINAFNYNSDW